MSVLWDNEPSVRSTQTGPRAIPGRSPTPFRSEEGELAQLARALAWHARGHEFDSRILHKKAGHEVWLFLFFDRSTASFRSRSVCYDGALPSCFPSDWQGHLRHNRLR